MTDCLVPGSQVPVLHSQWRALQPWVSHSPSLGFSKFNCIIGLFHLSVCKAAGLYEVQDYQAPLPRSLSAGPTLSLPLHLPSSRPAPVTTAVRPGLVKARASPPACTPRPPQLPPRPAVLGERGLGDGCALLFPRPPPGLRAGEGVGMGGC